MAKTNIQVDINADPKGFNAGVSSATDAANDFNRQASQSANSVASQMNRLADESKKAGDAIKGMNVCGVSIDNIKSAFTSAAGAGAILGKGIESLGKIASFVLEQIAQKAKDIADALARTTESIREVTSASQKRRDGEIALLKEIDALNQNEKLSEAQKAKMVSLVKQLEREYKNYGVTISDATGKAYGVEKAYTEALQKDAKKRMQANHDEQAALKKELAQQNSIIKGAWATSSGNSSATEAAKKVEEITKRLNELRREEQKLRNSDAAGDYRRESSGRKADQRNKEIKEFEDSIAKEKQLLGDLAQERKSLGQDDFANQRDALKKQYDANKKALGGDYIPKDSLNQLDAWYADKLKAINGKQKQAQADANAKAVEEAKKAEQEKLKLTHERNKKALDNIRASADEETRIIKQKYDAERREAQRANDERNKRDAKRVSKLETARGKYNFGSLDFDPLNDTGRERSRRRINYRLDASISEKMARQAQGERVTYNFQERKRIKEAQGLDEKKKNLEESIAQRNEDAAKTQERAASKMEAAVSRLKEKATAAQNAIAPSDLNRGIGILHNDLAKIVQNAYFVK